MNTFYITFETHESETDQTITGVYTLPFKGFADADEAVAAFENMPEYCEVGFYSYWGESVIGGPVDVTKWN